jgi:hypothetical protein
MNRSTLQLTFNRNAGQCHFSVDLDNGFGNDVGERKRKQIDVSSEGGE